MLPKGRRVTTELFEEVRTKGLRHHTPHLLFMAIETPPTSLSMWSVAVSKKVGKTAVLRNRIKRKINGILQKHKVLLPKGYAGVLFPKQGTEKIQTEVLSEEIKTLLNRLKARI